MNNKVFISGKVTGDPNYAHKFEAAEATILRTNFFNTHGVEIAQRTGYFGYQPVNPTMLTLFDIPIAEYTWSVCMMVCLWHLAGCSTVYMLYDWEQSRGAKIEHWLARILNKKIIYQ